MTSKQRSKLISLAMNVSATVPIGKNGLTESVIELADKLGFLVIADGVDSKEQLQAFTKMRCFLLEGLHFSTPERENEAIH